MNGETDFESWATERISAIKGDRDIALAVTFLAMSRILLKELLPLIRQRRQQPNEIVTLKELRSLFYQYRSYITGFRLGPWPPDNGHLIFGAKDTGVNADLVRDIYEHRVFPTTYKEIGALNYCSILIESFAILNYYIANNDANVMASRLPMVLAIGLVGGCKCKIGDRLFSKALGSELNKTIESYLSKADIELVSQFILPESKRSEEFANAREFVDRLLDSFAVPDNRNINCSFQEYFRKKLPVLWPLWHAL
jgi:hypothetical protein